MDEQFLKIFVEVIREQIAQKDTVKLDGIGEFNHKHRKQFQQQYSDGRVVMVPPKDRIEFTSAKEKVYG